MANVNFSIVDGKSAILEQEATQSMAVAKAQSHFERCTVRRPLFLGSVRASGLQHIRPQDIQDVGEDTGLMSQRLAQ